MYRANKICKQYLHTERYLNEYILESTDQTSTIPSITNCKPLKLLALNLLISYAIAKHEDYYSVLKNICRSIHYNPHISDTCNVNNK